MEDKHLSIKTAVKLKNLGNLDGAISVLNNLIENNPCFSWYYYYLGECLKKKSKFEEATEVYNRATQLNSNSATLHHGLAEVLLQRGELDDTIYRLQQAIDLKADVTVYYQTLALACEVKSDFVLALNSWQKIIAIQPNHNTARQKVDWLQTDVAKDLIDKGEKLNQDGNIKEAVNCYQQALALNPQQPRSVYRTHGNCLINLGKFQEAETTFQQLKQLYPERPDGYHDYAKIANSLADWELALERWHEGITKFPENIGFHTQKGNALVKLERFDEAKEIFLGLIEKYPNQINGYSGYASLANHLGDWELALESWQEAITKFPQKMTFQVKKGNVLINLNRFDEAEEVFLGLIKNYPNQPQGYDSYARVARCLAKYELALERWQEAIQNCPWHIPAYLEAGKILKNMGRLAEAEEKYEQVLEKNPNDFTALLQSGLLLSQRGNRELALERFERIIQSYTLEKSADAYILAATELKNLNRLDEAEEKYEQALHLHPNGSSHQVVKMGTSLTSIQELSLLLDRLAKKQPDNAADVIFLARLTNKKLFAGRNYSAPIAKDAPSLLRKLKILKDLYKQYIINVQEDCDDLDWEVAQFGYNLYVLATAQLLNNKYLRLFSFYFHTLIHKNYDFIVLSDLNLGIQTLEKESQRLNNSQWVSLKINRSEIIIKSLDNFGVDGLKSSAQYVMGTEEPVERNRIKATVKYLPKLMDEEKEYFEPSIQKILKINLVKLKSRQSVEIFKDLIFQAPFAISEGHIVGNTYYTKIITKKFVNELTNQNISNSQSLNWMSRIVDPRVFLEEIAISKKAFNNYYQEELVFGIPVIIFRWGGYQNYGHLLIDQITSLILYQKLNLSCQIFVPHITNMHWEIFSSLGIAKEKILVKQEVKFKYLITARYKYDLEIINFYRKLAKSIVDKKRFALAKTHCHYVYISRRYSQRAMANEVEVEESMKSLGFSIIYAERLSFEEQAILMYHASVVVSHWGAGIINCVMCHPNTSILEIYPPFAKEIHRFALFIYVLGEFNYFPLLGEEITHGWEINLNKLKRVVTAILEQQ